MRRVRTIVQAVSGATVVAGGPVASPQVAQVITIPVACGDNGLVAAVNLANSTATSDTLVLAGGCTYRIAEVGATGGLTLTTGNSAGRGGGIRAIPAASTAEAAR